MQNAELLTVVNGGIQTIIPEALLLPQVIYLDFDGELTSYHNHDLDIHIDDVAVEDSGLTPERIADIVQELNRQFTAQNVVFVTERPSDTEYSAIYVGKTSSFNEYGNFSGIAETIDVGNTIKDDMAFVMLDSTADDATVVETLSHEAQHLVGTLEHSGESIDRFAHTYIYDQTYTGAVTGGLQLYHYGSSSYSQYGSEPVHYYYDKAENVEVFSGGVITLQWEGATVNNAIIRDDGVINAGIGVIDNITVSTGGALIVGINVNASNITYKGGALVNGQSFQYSYRNGMSLSLHQASFFNNNLDLLNSRFSGIQGGGAIQNMHGNIQIDSAVFVGNYTSKSGGAIYNTANGTISIVQGEFLYNSAVQGGAVRNAVAGDYNPVFFEGGNIIFEENYANQGGAIFGDGNTTLIYGSFICNSAKMGGAIFQSRGGRSCVIQSALFDRNTAINNGGAIYTSWGGQVAIGQGEIKNNSADYGAGIYNDIAGSVSISSTTFLGNVATSNGGGLYNVGSRSTYAVNYSYATLSDVVFTENQAEKGGAIYNEQQHSIVNLTNATFSTEADTIWNGGVLNLNGSIIINSELTFDISNKTTYFTYDPMVTNFDAISGTPSFSVNVSSSQAKYRYVLASNASQFDGTITIKNDEEKATYGELTLNSNLNVGSRNYSLIKDNLENLVLVVDDSKDIPDQVLEKLARNDNSYSVYKEQESGKILHVSYGGKNYYFLVDCVASDDTGFYAMGLLRIKSPDNPIGNEVVVVCRGSETTDIANWSNLLTFHLPDFPDWEDDFNPNGVGVGQYNSTAASQIKAWLQQDSIHSNTVYFTGHSLGGALAQRFAADYQGKIGGCVTFNSPGINTSSEISADKVHHYIVDGDLISMVGNGFVYGDSDSDSWYTIYQDNNVFSDTLTDYLLNRHTETWTSRNQASKSGDILDGLAADSFSYIGSPDPDNFNAEYTRFILSLATQYGNSKDTVICSCADRYIPKLRKECMADLNTANLLTTRERAESFRIDTDYKDFLLVLAANYLKKDYGVKSGITLGDKDLYSISGHRIRTIEYSGDLDYLTDILYDFTDQKFIPINFQKIVSDSYSIANYTRSNATCLHRVSFDNAGDGWKCLSLPNPSNNFMTLSSVLTDGGETVAQENIFELDNKIIVLDDHELCSSYTFSFERDWSVVTTVANLCTYEDIVSKQTTSIQLELSDIDSSKVDGGDNDEVTITIKNNHSSETMTINLSETLVDGIFTGTLAIGGDSGVSVIPGENLMLSYLDANAENGEMQTITTEIPVLHTDVDVSIDETGLDSKYDAITEDVIWYRFNVLVDNNTLAGRYVLAENLGDAPGACVVWGNDSNRMEELSVEESVRVDANTYTKQIIDDKLVLTVQTAPRTIHWTEIENTAGYVVEFSQDNFQSVFQVHCDETQVDLLNLPNGEYSYRIRTLEGDEWLFKSTVTVKNNVVAEQRVADADANKDVFFGNARGIWTSNYQALHTELGMTAELDGKNRIEDLFFGSDDASILLLTDDANGDALCLDDIYSLFPEGLDAQARIAKIDEIRAGQGNDVVDLTSQRFEYVGAGMTVHGGLGDDVIWANHGDNRLFGDFGNDRIVGASGNDMIAGGAGDDLLHGGGGDDSFVFGGNWGNDKVEQLASGKVTLWFAEETGVWNKATLTYTDGTNSVKVSGVSDVTLKFGDDGSAQYQNLLAAGAFDESSNDFIFTKKDNRGMLA